MELRSTATPTTVVASCAALLQRDGDVVALDGTSPVSIAATAGQLSCGDAPPQPPRAMTLGGVALSAAPATVDFTSIATSSYGTSARKSISGLSRRKCLGR
ncbi:MAG: hypothetical protein IPP33_02500 [Flavobacteriales bacterium]|nr:hypothetical protein [Flavobacteriales bacterium]